MTMKQDYYISTYLTRRAQEYRKAKRTGRNIGKFHNDTVNDVHAELGPVAAEYFDRHEELPPADGMFMPWPMSPEAHRNLQLGRFGVASIGGFLGLISAPWLTPPFPVGLLIIACAALLAVGILQLVLWLFKPKDIEQRKEASRDYAARLKTRQAEEEGHPGALREEGERHRREFEEEHVEVRPGWWLDKTPTGGPATYCLLHAERGKDSDPLPEAGELWAYGATIVGHIKPNPDIHEDLPLCTTYREHGGELVVGKHETREEAIEGLIAEFDRRVAAGRKVEQRSQQVDALMRGKSA